MVYYMHVTMLYCQYILGWAVYISVIITNETAQESTRRHFQPINNAVYTAFPMAKRSNTVYRNFGEGSIECPKDEEAIEWVSIN